MIPLSLDETTLAWSIVNDHYLTDLPLLYPPHVIAATAALLGVVMKPTQGASHMQASNIQGALSAVSGGPVNARVKKITDFIAESTISIEAMMDVTQELISLYEVWDGYKESLCKEPIVRFVKARGLEK